MHIHFLRHATLVVETKDAKILVDPMLSPAEAMDPVANAANANRIPLVDLPLTDVELRTLLAQIDAVLVTHVHRDHWDARAVELLRKDIPIICQAGDEAKIGQAGFSSVAPVETEYVWRGIRLNRTDGHHGTGEVEQKMGHVSGFVVRAPAEPSLYIAGDTIFCPEVAGVLHAFQPDVVVVNAGEAKFLTGGPITMSAQDVAQVCRGLPKTKVVAVHMEAVNHCGLTREMLKEYLRQEGLESRVQIPSDGARIEM